MSRRNSDNFFNSMWPSFVDVMSNLFVLMLFMVVVFLMTNFISTAINPTVKDDRIAQLEKMVEDKDNLNQKLIANIKAIKGNSGKVLEESRKKDEALQELTNTLDFTSNNLKREEIKNEGLANKVAELNMFILQMEGDIIKKENQIKALENNETNLKNTVSKLTTEMQKLNDVFDATDKYIAWQKVQIVELGKKLNRALANKTAELWKVRSGFFEELSQALVGNDNFVMEGDRFVMPSEIFFEKQSAEIGPKGCEELRKIANVLKDAMKKFPDDMDWILRVDGHTDITPIKKGNGKYLSNWELSVDRAISVVKFLISEGIPENRLAATGFGEFHPLVMGVDAKSLQKNRRIEFKLTEK
ncbi:OmpA family protein [bacterium]|nr:OmpA family protein [bacterium]